MSVFFYFCSISVNMIVVIGADGFLGDRMVVKLREADRSLSSERNDGEEGAFAKGTEVVPFGDIDEFFSFLPSRYQDIEWIVFCDKRIPNAAASVFRQEIVQKLWTVTARYSVPLLYAFYQPTELQVTDFSPDRFVLWAGRQYRKPPFWYIFRVGEVYGRQEDVPGETTSRVYSFYRQILSTGEITLPERERAEDETSDGRDYLYVQDAVRVFYWFMQHRPANGVYDLGSGFGRSDLALANAIFRALKLPPRVRYSHAQPEASEREPESFRPDLRDLRKAGYRKPFFSVEKGMKSLLRKPHGTEIHPVFEC